MVVLGLAAGCAGSSASSGSQVVAVTLCAEGQSLSGGRCVAVSAPRASASTSSVPPLRRPSAAGTSGESLDGLVGRWVGEDSNGEAIYDLTIHTDGRFEQEISTIPGASGRSEGSCLQSGRARVEEGQLFWFFEKNSCNAEYEERESPDRITEQGARSFTLDAGGYQVVYMRK